MGVFVMKQLYIKQKMFTLSEKFTVTDEFEMPQYYVEGSFFKIPKEFIVTDQFGSEIARITKKFLSFLPKFFVEVSGEDPIVLTKEFTFFKARYSIDAKGINVEGNWWDMNFSVYVGGRQVAIIDQRWFSWGDTYEVQILDESLEHLIISLVIAIDCVKADESNNG
jgi:uncharacterized protein YxjI